MKMFLTLATLLAGAISAAGARAEGPASGFGIAAKRPVFGGACPICIWGPIGEAVKEAMRPYGYDVEVCYNCNRSDSPRFVAKAMRPHLLTESEKALGDPVPPDAPVDFGVTNTHVLWFSYEGLHEYKADGPQKQLRLIAFLEDPHYFIAAVKADSGITDLRQIKDKHLAVRVIADQNTMGRAVLDYYGLTKDALASWGGSLSAPYAEPYVEGQNPDVVISNHGSLTNNIENRLFYEVSQKFNLRYLELAPELRDRLARDFRLEKAEVPLGLLRGVDRRIPTVVRNGQAIYGRADMPDDFAFTVAKALDEHQDLLKYLNRPYFYNIHRVWKTVGEVPLHPGAERYYREAGYLK